MKLDLQPEDFFVIYTSVNAALESVEEELEGATKYERKEIMPLRNKIAEIHSYLENMMEEDEMKQFMSKDMGQYFNESEMLDLFENQLEGLDF